MVELMRPNGTFVRIGSDEPELLLKAILQARPQLKNQSAKP
jgi:hypothetical protein